LTDTLRVGRHAECELQLEEPAVSRRHAEFEPEDDHCLVRDLGSRHGTLVNGERIEAPRRVRDGDVVQVGPIEIVVTRASLDTAATVMLEGASLEDTVRQPQAAVEQRWHYLTDAGSHDPLPESELRSRLVRGELGPETRVWRPGLEEWVSTRAAGLLPAEDPKPHGCPACGRPVEPHWRFCGGCGRTLT
jgi:pSer/pThr/pTyr-binding forkhead associated (FHA) protein